MTEHPLRPLLAPRSVVVLGASDRDGSLGGRVFANLSAGGFAGDTAPVNPKHEQVHGVRCYARAADLPFAPDLAVVVVPAAKVLGALRDCEAAGTRVAVVMSAGFVDSGRAGAQREASLKRAMRGSGMRLLGPNSLGLMRPSLGLNASAVATPARPGRLALISQSGSMGSAVLDWAERQRIGFSSVVMTGTGLEVSRGELLDFLLSDDETDGVLMYVEGVRQPRRFLGGLRAVARAKPIVVMKPGRAAEPDSPAAAHTGALVGHDAAFDAALARTGAVRVRSLGALFTAAEALARGLRVQPGAAASSGSSELRGTLAVVSNGYAPAAMALDRLSDHGLAGATLDEAGKASLAESLPNVRRALPLILRHGASPETVTKAVAACDASADTAATLVAIAPTAFNDPTGIAEALVASRSRSTRPLIGVWMGGSRMDEGHARLKAAEVPVFRTPEAAVDAFHALHSHARNQRLALELPAAFELTSADHREAARALLHRALDEGRQRLSDIEGKQLLSEFGVEVSEAYEARSFDEARERAEQLRYPVVVKVLARGLRYRATSGTVNLGIDGAVALRRAWHASSESVGEDRFEGVLVERMYRRFDGRRLSAGVRLDPVFGPVLVLGHGGVAARHALHDRRHAVALPPLSRYLARSLIESSPAAPSLEGSDAVGAVNLAALEDVLLRLSEIACEIPCIAELELVNLVVDPHGAHVQDVQVHLTPGADTTPSAGYRHVAIHPYPSHLESTWTARNGEVLIIRPIRPEDAAEQARFVKALSRRTRIFRFMHELRELPPRLLSRFTQIDYDREMAFVATCEEGGARRQIGSARYARLADGTSVEFAVVVADEWQRHGVASELMRRLIAHAVSLGLERMVGSVLSENTQMLAFAGRFGFVPRIDPDEAGVTIVELALEAAPPAQPPRRRYAQGALDALEQTSTRASDLAELANRAVKRASRRRPRR